MVDDERLRQIQTNLKNIETAIRKILILISKLAIFFLIIILAVIGSNPYPPDRDYVRLNFCEPSILTKNVPDAFSCIFLNLVDTLKFLGLKIQTIFLHPESALVIDWIIGLSTISLLAYVIFRRRSSY